MTEEDNGIGTRIQSGDQDAFRRLVESQKNRVTNICFRFLKNQEDAEDTAQDVFIEVHRSIPKFRGDSSLSTWIYRIAVSKSLNVLRQKTRKKRGDSLIHHGQVDILINRAKGPKRMEPEERLENKERQHILHKFLETLSWKQKTEFTLAKVEGLKIQEIADIMKCSVPSTESLIHRAKQNLQKKLTYYYEKNI
jgi:RNA polymerase sigma factor (sigma-70 family)